MHEQQRDIFEMSREEAEAHLRAKIPPRPAKPRGGYAAVPGTGPKNETCKTCRHLVRKQMANTYLKCGLMRAYWTGGAGTDVKANSPACARWEAQESNEKEGNNHDQIQSKPEDQGRHQSC